MNPRYDSDVSMKHSLVAGAVAALAFAALSAHQTPQDLQNPQDPQIKTRGLAPGEREVQLPCGDQSVPPGRLMGLRPQLDRGASVRVIATLPDGRREILGWFRDFDPDYAPTYWLRTPLDMPAGARLLSDGDNGGCRIIVVQGPASGVPSRVQVRVPTLSRVSLKPYALSPRQRATTVKGNVRTVPRR